jgi:uncharacterized beta barrel domain-containing protein DUF5777
MNRVLAIAVLVLFSLPAYSMPQFLQLYRNDPFRNPAVDGCNTCHMSPEGGDARNAFGQAFENGGEQITPMLRAQFPDRFVYPVSKMSDSITIHYSDPDKKQIVLETGGTKNLIDVDKKAVNGTPAATGNSSAPATLIDVTKETKREIPVDAYAREGAYFGSRVVNLPNGKPQKKGGVDFFIGHRFSEDVDSAGLGGLYGFDSGATVAYGVSVGLTNRISVAMTRSNLFKTISLDASFQAVRQSRRVPMTLQFHLGVDGQNNFGLYKRANNSLPRVYSPFIQIVATRTFKDRVSFTMVPMAAFNTRNEAFDLPGFAFGVNHNDTLALGLGTGIRLLKTTSLVGEFIPRTGFKGSGKDRPGVSIGLQKSTFRHTFELLISRQQPMTPGQYSFQGTDTFKVGFNIYRRIR